MKDLVNQPRCCEVRSKAIRETSCEFVDRGFGLAVETIHEFTRKDTKKT